MNFMRDVSELRFEPGAQTKKVYTMYRFQGSLVSLSRIKIPTVAVLFRAATYWNVTPALL